MTRADRERGSLGFGAVAAAAQVVVNAAVLLLLYRFVKGEVGAERFGVWALVVGTTLSASVAEFGISGAALRFVAHALGEGDTARAARITETAVLSAAGIIGAAALVLYLPLTAGLDYLLRAAPDALRAEAHRLLPWTLSVVTLTGAAASALGALDGAQRVHLRSLLVVLGSLLLGASAVALVPRYGLLGFVGAQALQGTFLLASGWALLRGPLEACAWVPRRWSRGEFKRLIGYGMRWQLIITFHVLTDPVAKTIAAHFGGLVFVGHYEFASKVAIQCRNVLAAMQAALLPYLTRLHAEAPGEMGRCYALSVRATAAVVVFAIPAALSLTPLLEQFWGGPVAPLLWVLLPAWGVNLLSNSAYFDFAARGTLGPNIVSHVVHALLNGVLGLALGTVLGGFGVTLAFALALVVGSLTTVALYHARFSVPLRTLAERYDILALLVGPTSAAGLYLLAVQASLNGHGWGAALGLAVGVVAYAGVALAVLWHHPVRRALLQALRPAERPATA